MSSQALRRAAAMVGGTLIALSGLSQARAADDFYKGKTFTLVVGFSPGGGYDQYARVLGRYLPDHIPGKPSLIVQNMPGAGSLTAVRYLDASAPKDGTVMTAFNSGLITDSLLEPSRVQLKLSQMAWIGSITRDFRVCYAWKASGITSLKDIMPGGGKQFIIGGTGKGSANYMNGAMLRTLVEANVKQVLGFPGSNDQRLAIERGELNGDCGSWSSIPEEWSKTDKIVPLLNFSPAKTPDMPDLPYARDLIKDPVKQKVFDILIAAGELGRPYVMSRSVPAERVAIIRQAFDDTMRDPQFLAEAKKQDLPVYPVQGTAAQKMVEDIYAAPADIVAMAKTATE